MGKYEQIYSVIEKHPEVIMNDRSEWKCKRSYLSAWRPLWIILEFPQNKLRLWITQEGKHLNITTANTSLPSSSRAYSESHKKYAFRTQAEVAKKLDELLSSIQVAA